MRGEFSTLRTELQSLLIIPCLAPHPIQSHRQPAGHRDLGDRTATTHCQVQEPTPPVGIVAYDGVSRLEETQECVALLADVPEALPAARRFLARNQSQIAAYLLATLKALRNPKNQDKGQCRDRANPRMRHQPLHLWPLFRGLLNRCTQFVDLRVESVQ